MEARTDTSELDATADILVVDDNRGDRLAVDAVLSSLGHRVVLAASADQALDLIARNEFALILSDIQMPGMDGFQLVARVRERGEASRTPLVFLTERGLKPEDLHRAYALGALDCLAKPVEEAVLRGKVSACVKLYLQAKELRRRKQIIADKEREALAAYAAADKALSDLLKAERANRAKDTYIGILGHDLRNPLNAVTLSAQLLLGSQDLNDRDRQLAARIARSSHRMRDMVRDILDFTRCALGETFPIAPASGDLGEICQDVIEELQLVHPDRDIRIESSGDLAGEWDSDRVEQVVSNLVSNGLEHGEAAVTVRLQGRPDRVFLLVHNNGPPIPDEILPTVFEPFRRSESGSAGLGLGLYIVREIIRAHGGAVNVVSSAGAGTTFITEWPRRRVEV